MCIYVLVVFACHVNPRFSNVRLGPLDRQNRKQMEMAQSAQICSRCSCFPGSEGDVYLAELSLMHLLMHLVYCYCLLWHVTASCLMFDVIPFSLELSKLVWSILC